MRTHVYNLAAFCRLLIVTVTGRQKYRNGRSLPLPASAKGGIGMSCTFLVTDRAAAAACREVNVTTTKHSSFVHALEQPRANSLQADIELYL